MAKREVILQIAGLNEEGHFYRFDARVELPDDLKIIQTVTVWDPRLNIALAHGSAVPRPEVRHKVAENGR